MNQAVAEQGARRVIDRCRELATLSEVAGETTRPFLCASARVVQGRMRAWMEDAGLDVRVDGMGNLRACSAGCVAGAPRLLLGSHLDTVPAAGAFDGILGVVLAIEMAAALHGIGPQPAFEVIGFSEEEGVRFSRPFLGSLAVVGRGSEVVSLQDRNGVTVAEALVAFGIEDSGPTELAPEIAAYLEVHIEQGPVLESVGLPLGVVDAIAGQSRYTMRFRGQSNHAGTTPMPLRRDALAAAAEWIVAVESRACAVEGLVATVGRIDTRPGASNIIPGEVMATLDVRHRCDTVREQAAANLVEVARGAASRRGVTVEAHRELSQNATPMDAALVDMLALAAEEATGSPPPRMTSGAGHDAMILAERVPAAMLFVRSPGGLSHHPDESVLTEDVAVALRTLVQFLPRFEARNAAALEGSRHA